MGCVSVLSSRCCMFVSCNNNNTYIYIAQYPANTSCNNTSTRCIHHVAVLNAAFCMTCSLLMLVEDARGDNIEDAYSRAGIMTA